MIIERDVEIRCAIGLDESLSVNDKALVAEALRRVQAARTGASHDPGAVMRAIGAALKAGRRDLFSLVKAGTRAG